MYKDITVACVLWKGNFRKRQYTEDWVINLKGMVERNMPQNFNFICLTNAEPIPGVKTQNLRANLAGWWAKLELFTQKLPGDRILYLDLDLLVLQNLDAFINFPHPFGILRGKPGSTEYGVYPGYNSSVMVWDKGQEKPIAEKIRSGIDWTKYRGDQDFLKHNFPNFATFPDGWVTKIRYHRKGDKCIPPKQTKILLCMPYKNNVAVQKYPWMKEFWK
jgi:hypothetical protein